MPASPLALISSKSFSSSATCEKNVSSIFDNFSYSLAALSAASLAGSFFFIKYLSHKESLIFNTVSDFILFVVEVPYI